MPRKSDTKSISDPFLDRRTKLLPCQKEMVKYWYDQGESVRAITRMFQVSRRLIQFVLFPERKTKDLENRRDRGGSKAYYHKEYHAQKTREHRNHKKNLDKFDGF